MLSLTLSMVSLLAMNTNCQDTNETMISSELLTHKPGSEISIFVEEALISIFENIDSDRDGDIDEMEVSDYLYNDDNFGGFFEKAYGLFDINENNKLEYNELVYSMKQFCMDHSNCLNDVDHDHHELEHEFLSSIAGLDEILAFNRETEIEWLTNIMFSILDQHQVGFVEKEDFIQYEVDGFWSELVSTDELQVGFEQFRNKFFYTSHFKQYQKLYNAPAVELEQYASYNQHLINAHNNAQFILNEVGNNLFFEPHQFVDITNLFRRRLEKKTATAIAKVAGGLVGAAAGGAASEGVGLAIDAI